MKNSRTFLILVFIIGFSNAVLGANTLSDETEFGPDLSEPLQAVDSYHQALGVWKTAEDISRWAAGSFRYDKSRASQLSTNRRRRQKEISIYDPSELFAKKAGICVDLARFGFETLKSIDPASTQDI